jgi:hypothetical protein
MGSLAHRGGHCGVSKDREVRSSTQVDWLLNAGWLTHAARGQEEHCEGCNNARHHGRVKHVVKSERRV